MLYQDGFAVVGTYHGAGVVAVGIFHSALAVACVGGLLAVERVGVHGYQYIHLVAAVDVDILADGADAVGGVYVTVMVFVVGHAPVALVAVPVGIEVVAV